VRDRGRAAAVRDRGQTAEASAHATARDAVVARRDPGIATAIALLGETTGMLAGAVSAGLPFLLLSIPGLVLFVLLPLILIAIPTLAVALVIGPPLLAARFLWRRIAARSGPGA
jgi:hypothetical protein